MKKLTALFFALAAMGGLVAGYAQPSSEATGSAQADGDWQAYLQVGRETPANAADMTRREQAEFLEQRALKQRTLALKFLEDHPADPRRWNIVAALTPMSPRFIKEFGEPNAQGVPSTTIDEAAAAAWKAKVAELKAAMASATDLPLDVKEQQAWGDFAKDFRATTTAKNSGQPFDYGQFHARFDAHVAKFGALANMPARAADYLGALESSMPGAGEKEWNYLLASSNADLRARAGTELAKIEAKADLKKKPLELAFTAVDGRAVDLAKLRGKVVLIDFWATWCGPCVAELPNVKNVYAAYHDKGFEIVGIALENGNLQPTDTPEKTAEKMERAKTVLTNFTAKENMPWPQYFDGKHWKNDISTKYAINSIPAMFLLDQDGKVVSTAARGEALEREVKRLLKL